MPRYTFHTEAVRTKGGKFHSTFEVTGGELDTSVVNDLTDVTLERQSNGKYLLVTGGSAQERSQRNLHVYYALTQWFTMDNRVPLDNLIAEDRANRA